MTEHIMSTTVSSLPNFQIIPHKNYLFQLEELSMLEICGRRAAEFLQGQLSCDMRLVTPTTIQQGALCNLKGRVMAVFDVLNWQGYRVILPANLVVDTQNSLKTVAMVSRVSLHEVNHYHFYGFYLTNPDDLLPTGFKLPLDLYGITYNEVSLCYSIGDGYYILALSKLSDYHHIKKALEQPFKNNQQLSSSMVWHFQQLQRLRTQIYPHTRGMFLPHRLNLPKFGVINFTKGCYRGQEIIARMHYRATQKHYLQSFIIKTCEPLTVGAKLFDSKTNQEIGQLIDLCLYQMAHYLIVASLLLEHTLTILIEGHTHSITLCDVKIVH